MTDHAGALGTDPNTPRLMGGYFRPERARSETATHRIFVFPHAGGSAAAYGRWTVMAPPHVDLRVIQLPGRHDRRDEPPFTEIAPLLDALTEAFIGELDGRPYALFGHSLGGVLAFHLATALFAEGEDAPALIGISGASSGQQNTAVADMLASVDVPEEDFAERAIALGLVPEQVRDRPETLAMVLPSLRADLTVAATAPPLPDNNPGAAIAGYQGSDDPLLPPGSMADWAKRTPEFLGVTQYPGGHFYLENCAGAVLTDLSGHLDRLTR